MSGANRHRKTFGTAAAVLAAAVMAGSSALTAVQPVTAYAEEYRTQQIENAVNTLRGVTLTLSGDIGVNFYLDMKAPADCDEIVIGGPQGERVYSAADMTPVSEGEYAGLYKAVYLVQPAQIYEDIALTIRRGGADAPLYDTNGERYSEIGASISVGEYIGRLKEQSIDSCLSGIVGALESYCEYAEGYFKNTAVSDDAFLPEVTAKKLEKYKLTSSGNLPKGVSYVGSSLLLDSKTTFRLYFDGDITGARINGSPAVIGHKNGHSYIQLEDIAAEDLDKEFTASVGGCKYTFSALSYAYTVLNSEGDNSEKPVAKLVKALYAYSFAANMYVEKFGSATISDIDVTYDRNEGSYSFTYHGDVYKARYSAGNGGDWKIIDSINISNKADMQVICEALQRLKRVEGCITRYRTAHDMAQEWEIHNRAYHLIENGILGIKFNSLLSRLKDVDLDRKDQGKTMSDFISDLLNE